ncbi:MAG: hypothetical protein ABF315_09955, partial [Lentimonas sp.]
SLLFIKCFTLEYLVVRYNVPINSIVYVWSLSLLMAGVATIIYLQRKVDKLNKPLSRLQLHQCVWALTVTSIIILSAISLATEWMSELRILPTHAILLGASYVIQGILLKQLPHIISGFGWWIGAKVIFQVNAPNDLLAFAASVLLFATLPILAKYIHSWQSVRRHLKI